MDSRSAIESLGLRPEGPFFVLDPRVKPEEDTEGKVRAFALALFLLLLTSCTKTYHSDRPAPVVVNKINQSSMSLPELVIYTSTGKKIIKKPSVWNRKTLSFSEGMPQKYRVKTGENLYRISKENAVPIATIIAKNNLSAPYTIYPGQILILVSPRIHLVAEDDDLYKIAMLHKVNLSTLVTTNNLQAPYRLKSGQQLIVPNSPTNEEEAGKPIAQYIDLPQRKNSAFLRPVEGRVISSYGEQGRGLHNDGVNIEASLGTPVHVADDGVVAYTGRGMRSYGNLVLVKHGGGWLTAYAHLHDIKVIKGDRLKRGQILGTVGKSGIKIPQLHFEVRKGTKPVNPMLYLI